MQKLIVLLCLSALISSCTNSGQSSATEENTTEAPSQKPKTADEAFEEAKANMSTQVEDLVDATLLPSIEFEVLENLWENCDYVDYVYYELPISASLDNKGAIQSAIGHIAQNRAAKLPNCKAIGRVFYQIKGENVLQGDIFFTKGCTYFLWVDDKGKYYAGNLMMDSGLKFFASNIQAATGRMQPK